MAILERAIEHATLLTGVRGEASEMARLLLHGTATG
jgi:hypothetical protein